MLHAVLLAGWLFAQAVPGGNPIVTPPDIHVTSTTQLVVPPRDPQAIADDAAVANQSLIVNTIQPVPVQWVNELCSMPNIWTTTPPGSTYENADIVRLSTLVLAGSLALGGIVFAASGLEIMGGDDPKERLSRIFYASALAVGNLLWWRWGIDLNNALAGAIAAPDPCGSLIKPHIELAHPDPGAAIAEPAQVIVTAVVALLLLFALWFRLGWLNILIVAGSLALMCKADDRTDQIASWYQRLAIGTLYGQVLLAVGLATAKATSSTATGLGSVLVTIVILWICKDLLSTLSSQATSRGSRLGGAVVGTVMRRLITKVL